MMKTSAPISNLLRKLHRFKKFVIMVERAFFGYKKRCKAYMDRIAMLWNKYWGTSY